MTAAGIRMRRKDRELTTEEAWEILEGGEYGIMGLSRPDGEPYAVPMSYACEGKRIYLHCTNAGGLKRELLEQNPRACFTVVGPTEILPDKFSTRYLSAIARCRVRVLTDTGEKKNGLRKLLEKYSPDFMESGNAHIEAAFSRVDVLELTVEEITGKGRKN